MVEAGREGVAEEEGVGEGSECGSLCCDCSWLLVWCSRRMRRGCAAVLTGCSYLVRAARGIRSEMLKRMCIKLKARPSIMARIIFRSHPLRSRAGTAADVLSALTTARAIPHTCGKLHSPRYRSAVSTLLPHPTAPAVSPPCESLSRRSTSPISAALSSHCRRIPLRKPSRPLFNRTSQLLGIPEIRSAAGTLPPVATAQAISSLFRSTSRRVLGQPISSLPSRHPSFRTPVSACECEQHM